MATVLLVIHLMVAAALVAVVLLQRSEGGALGIGGGGGLMTGRGTANLLTRMTAVLAACFFLTSILLTILAQRGGPARSVFDQPAQSTTTKAPEGSPASQEAPKAPESRGGILDKLKPAGPTVPESR